LGQLSDTATRLANDAGDDLVTNLKNLEPTVKALADVGPDLTTGLRFATAFPYGPTFADRVTRGDNINLFAVFDITYPRLKRTLFLGTRWGDQDAKFIPAPGDPFYLNYSYNPLGVGVAPPPPEAADGALPPPEAAASGQMPPVTEPVVPVVPPATSAPVTTSSQLFAGPYAPEGPTPSAPSNPGALPAPPAVPPTPGGGG
jgi:hypothetical protein